MDFVDLIVAVHDELKRVRVRHAFGGALALAYAAEPRGTADIDVNVFLGVDALEPVAGALGRLGYQPEPAPEPRAPVAGIRFGHGTEPFPIDVFPSLDDRYEHAAARVVRHPFGPGRRMLPFLSPEDLCVFKISFGRARDWVDLAAIADAGTPLDVDYVEEQLVALRGPTMYPEVAKLRALLRARRAGPAPPA